MSRPFRGRDFGLLWQQACIQSWLDAGFRVISVNAPEEIDELRSFAPTIEFRTITGGHSRPRVTDFFKAAGDFRNETVGIINADCRIIPNSGIIEHLSASLDGIVIAERVNLRHDILRLGWMNHGFDAFFFAASATDFVARDDHWRIGDVWCDFWLPLAFHVAGCTIKTLPAPILLHLNHDQAWDWAAWKKHFPRLIDLLRTRPLNDSGLMTELLSVDNASADDVHRLSNLLYLWLSSREALWRPDVGLTMMNLFDAFAMLPPTSRYSGLLGRVRSLKWTIKTFGLHRTLYMLGLLNVR
jgi:hypothetical protein